MKTEKLISKEFLTQDMEAKIVKITDKGQISIPIAMQKSLDVKKGDNLIMIENKNAIILKKLEENEILGWMKLAGPVFKKLWDNKYDKRWDDV